MVRVRLLAAVLIAGLAVPAYGEEQSPASLLMLRSPSLENARMQALDWLTQAGKTDDATRRAFDALWQPGDRPILDRVADTLALGDGRAADLLAQARNVNAPAPTAIPALLRDKDQPAFFRANLALAYAKALSARRVYEESLDALRNIKASEVVDPAAYHFHRAVAEYCLRQRDAARHSLAGLGDVADAPERYRAMGELMLQQMQAWKERDLGWIADTMDGIGRRLDLGRGGPQTRKMQRDVIAALDDLIRQLEPPDGPLDPNPRDPNDPREPSDPGPRRRPGPPGPNPQPVERGDGKVDDRDLRNTARNWGNLPEKERVSAKVELTRSLPAQHRDAMENYIKKLGRIER